MFEQKYIIMETIGHKSQKMTSIVRDKVNNYFIAKKVPVNDTKTMHEISMMKGLSHPNIIALHEIIEEDKYAYIIQQYCQEGDLQFHLKRHIRLKKYVSEDTVSRWMLQILLAIQYLHHLKIIHRDIRPKNIFLTSHGNLKIGSFKVSKLLEQQANYANTLINSPYYMTPQLNEGREYDYKVDIWAFGCVLYQICSLKPVVNIVNLGQLLNKFMKGKLDDLPYNYSKQLNLIYQKCMKRNPIERISARDLLKTNYFLGVMQKFIIDKGLNIGVEQKIPIKKYKIHKSKYERIKLKRKLIKQKIPSIDKKDNLFPKIQILSNKVQRKAISKDKKDKKDSLYTPNIKKSETSKEKYDRCISSQKKMVQLQPKKKYLQQKSEKNVHLDVQHEIVMAKAAEREKKLMLAPPLLPKPNKKAQKNSSALTSERRTKTKAIEDINGNFEMTMSREELTKELKNFQKQQLSQINEGISKVVENLKFLEQDEQIQFDFQQDNQLRLTTKRSGEQAESLLKTCKSKLQQLIQEINYKYCPDMEPIAEKTTEFDSNEFSKLRLLTNLPRSSS